MPTKKEAPKVDQPAILASSSETKSSIHLLIRKIIIPATAIALIVGFAGGAALAFLSNSRNGQTSSLMTLSSIIILSSLLCGSVTAALASRRHKAPILGFLTGGLFNLLGLLFFIYRKSPTRKSPTSQTKIPIFSTFSTSLMTFLLLEITLIELAVHFIIPWWSASATLSNLQSLRMVLSFLLYGCTAVSASLATSMTLAHPHRDHAVHAAHLIAIIFSLITTIAIGITIAFALSEPLVTGPIVTHLFAALLGALFTMILILTPYPLRKQQLLAATLAFSLFVFFTIPPSITLAASSGDISPSDCTRMTATGSFDATLTLFSVYAGPQFEYAISEMADGKAKLAVTTGLQLGFEFNFGGSAEKAFQTITHIGATASLKAGGNIALENTYTLPTKDSAEKLVSQSLGSYATATSVFPGLGWSTPAPTAPSLSHLVETNLDLKAGVELNLGASVVGDFSTSIHPQGGIKVKLNNDQNSDPRLVSDPSSIDVGFLVSGAGDLSAAFAVVGGKGSGEGEIFAYLTFKRPSSSLDLWLPESASLEVSGQVNASMNLGLLGIIGLNVESGKTADLLSNLQNLDNTEVLHAVTILITDLAANSDKGSVANPPSASEVQTALQTVVDNSDVTLTLGNIDSAGVTFDFSSGTGLTFGISADGALTITKLQAAYYSTGPLLAAGNSLKPSSSCTP